MSQAVHETHPEFWRPPSPLAAEELGLREAVRSETPLREVMAEVCPRCASEYLLGSRFCHTCGGRRPTALNAEARSDAAEMAGLWERAVGRVQSTVSRVSFTKAWNAVKFPDWLHYLHFHEIKERVGLSTASLIAFLLGLGCVAGSLLVGLLTVKTFVDWQAIQFYRAEWLLAATAAFVAGILLKKPAERDRE